MSHVSARPGDPAYPERLRALSSPPPIAFEGSLRDPRDPSLAVAVIGTRRPSIEAERFAGELAAALAKAGAIVVSGGAVGIDAAAHRGALSVGGRTLVIAATGRKHCFPKEHAALYEQVARGPGAVVWPFEDDVPALPGNFLRRNSVLVALADAVVIVQAGAPSGTLNAASWAKKLGRSLWAVAGPPWDPKFTGCRAVIEAGARVVTSIDGLLATLGLPQDQLTLPLGGSDPLPLPGALRAEPCANSGERKRKLPNSAPGRRLRWPGENLAVTDEIGRALVAACTPEPKHTDQIAENAGLCVSQALTRLLTLALENVLVEGPEGFYRRAE